MSRHRRSSVLGLILAGLVLVSPISARKAVLIELRSGDIRNGQIHATGFTFQINSERIAAGSVRFVIHIAEAGAAFSADPPDVALGRLSQTRSGTNIDGIRSLAARRNGSSADCTFEAATEILSGRDVIFSFTNPSTDGQGRPMPGAIIYFARLKDFLNNR